MSTPSNIVTRNAIFAKIRKLSASNNVYQLPDFTDPTNPQSVGIYDYVNSFYNYDLPAEFRSLKLKDVYTFVTTAGVDTYPFNSEIYTTVEMPCYCAKREIKLFNDPWSFYGVNYNWQQQQNFTSGNGTAGPYTGTTLANPLIRSINNIPTYTGSPNIPGLSQGNEPFPASRVMNLLITATISNGNTQNVTDDGNGNLIDPVNGNNGPLAGGYYGTISYSTGAISVTFGTAIPQGNPISIQYNPQKLNIPLSILYFQNQFTLRPVPDQGYTIELVAYRSPVQALLNQPGGTGTPELSEWWELLAVGAAKKIYEDRLDFDGVSIMDKMIQERYNVIRTRTYAQLGKQRINTIFADQLSYNYGSGGLGFGGGG